MKALVTGADGFIGSHLVAFLSAQGDQVIGWTRDGLSPDVISLREVTNAVANVDVDVVYHLAGQANVAQSWRDPADSIAVNAGGTANLLHALREAGSSARVLVMSSAEVYGIVTPDRLPIDEAEPFEPASPYGVSKVAAEHVARHAFGSLGQPVLICRPFNHVGPGQSSNYVASAIAERIVRNEMSGVDVLSVGDLGTTRDFVDVRDAVRAYRLIMERGTPGEAYNVSTGVETAVGTLVEMLIANSRVLQTVELDPSLLRPARLPRLAGSPEKLFAQTGWRPEISLEDTAAAIVDDWRSRIADHGEL